MNIWAACAFWLFWIILLWIVIYNFCVNIYFHFSWVYTSTPRSGNAGSYSNCMVNILRNCPTVFQSSYVNHSHQQWWTVWCLHILANTCYCVSFLFQWSKWVCGGIALWCKDLLKKMSTENACVVFPWPARRMPAILWCGILYSRQDGSKHKAHKKTAKRLGMARVLSWMNNVLNFYTFKTKKWPNHSQRPIQSCKFFCCC